MPGNIASSLRKVGVSDPVILLDEIDKLSSGNGLHGDPMAAMLEVLDPEQNHSFTDHYVNCPIDLSRVLFIATANTLETISPPLLDRTEVIHVSGYTHDEKVAIAKQYLIPKQAKAQGLVHGRDLVVGDDVLLKIAMSYTREAGVRSLEREIGAVARAKAVEFAEARKGTLKDDQGKAKTYDPRVRLEDLNRILGIETYEPEVADLQSRPGVSTGLAYQGSGSGGILHIETLLLPPGNGNLKLTGKLGDVIQESANLALSWVKAHAFQLGIVPHRESEFPKNDLHLHMPSGAIPKDGPSAGIAMVCALVSLWTGTPIPKELAMTGEITLRGLVTPVGGIKEKCLGAHRAGIKRLILPHRNRKDAEADLPANVRADMDISYVRTIWQTIELAFGNALYENAMMRNGSLEGIEEGRRLMSSEMESSRL
jgi:ATP-dependent Lon protease